MIILLKEEHFAQTMESPLAMELFGRLELKLI